jgi:hypothetical protein
MLSKILLTFLVLGSAHAADIDSAPPSIGKGVRGKNAVFVDFKKATYNITINKASKKAYAKSVIEFTSFDTGTPIFDLVSSVVKAKIDGVEVDIQAIKAPTWKTSFKTTKSVISPGNHTLEIEHNLSSGIKFNYAGVSVGFFMSDLGDRNFLEKYLPTNLEYDHYKMNIILNFTNTISRLVQANGAVKSLGKNSWEIDYPAYFTTSSVYLHSFPDIGIRKLEWVHTASDGRKIPATVYTKSSRVRPDNFKRNTIKILKELDRDYGPFPHNKIVIYGVGPMNGGMEHCGATITSERALGHELTHSYFARSVMPKNGNSGWVDEAIASWRDSRYKRLASTTFGGSNMGKHSPYRRTTDKKAYKQGRDFLAHLDYLLRNKKGLRYYLNEFHQRFQHSSVSTKDFANFLKFQSGENFDKLFEKYIWGGASPILGLEDFSNPNHPKLSEAQLKALL